MAGQQWGLLPSLQAGGAEQMQRDRWMLDQLASPAVEGAQALLRFYRWSEPTLSLGHHQEAPERAAASGLPVVRRPSGGAAVLHGGDLCYAIALAQPPRGRRRTYLALNHWLQLSFEALGAVLQAGEEPQSRQERQCFSSATAADLVDRSGRKRIGSAQLWRQGQLLQHGSIQLDPDPALWAALFDEDPPPALAQFSGNLLEKVLLQQAKSWLFGQPPDQLTWPEPWPPAARTSGSAATVSAIGPNESPRG